MSFRTTFTTGLSSALYKVGSALSRQIPSDLEAAKSAIQDYVAPVSESLQRRLSQPVADQYIRQSYNLTDIISPSHKARFASYPHKRPLTKSELDQTLSESELDISRLFALLRREAVFDEALSSPASENISYNLEYHVNVLLTLFEVYFPGPLPNNTDRAFFRLVLALHDMGKPAAIKSGNRNLEHQFTRKIITEVLTRLGYTEAQLKFALAVINDDSLGKYMQGANLSHTASRVIANAQMANMDPLAFLNLLLIFFKVDAGSYTTAAGGSGTLDFVFRFDPQNREIHLRKYYAILYANLRAEVRRQMP